MKTKVKITVVKREYYQDLADRFLANPQKGKCTIFSEGQEFFVTRETYNRFPYENDFCIPAWDAIKGKVYAALQGGNFYWQGWMRNPKEQILCCDDGVRPVVFLLERMDETE
ncbi:MAG TPA: TIGR04076 family protein [Candidatus Ventrousia excrementavium]|uniref:TIGR04076 family protein n=1 Tax=Candidatus Ventrousia excrementavium TaxID=2840961 RepID=A0A9D1LKI4_9CLOT|nr:TIGR04076 family protein [Candidatus Ventrousia excrementavium]